MRIFLAALGITFLITGCSTKERVLNIQNTDLCSTPVAAIHLDKINITNNVNKFDLSAEEIKEALTKSLTQTGCFIITSQKSAFTVDTNVEVDSEREVTSENFFKEELQEILKMTLMLNAHNGTKQVNATAKSTLKIQSCKIIGIKCKNEPEKDKRVLLENGAKQASLSLKNGFERH